MRLLWQRQRGLSSISDGEVSWASGGLAARLSGLNGRAGEPGRSVFGVGDVFVAKAGEVCYTVAGCYGKKVRFRQQRYGSRGGYLRPGPMQAETANLVRRGTEQP